MIENEPKRHPIGTSWAWVVADGTGLWVFGAAGESPANAWALGVASSDAHSLEQLRSLEAVRDSGRITLVRASLALYEAWKQMRSHLKCRVVEGIAVTVDEHVVLSRRTVSPALGPVLHPVPDPMHGRVARMN